MHSFPQSVRRLRRRPTLTATGFVLASALTFLTGTLQAQSLIPDEGPQTTFRRGDTDANTEVNVTDAVATLRFLFVGDKRIECADAADANDDGEITIADAAGTLSFLFVGNVRIPSPGAFACGEDPTDDSLGCDFAPECRPRALTVPQVTRPERPQTAPPQDAKAALIAAFPAVELQVEERTQPEPQPPKSRSDLFQAVLPNNPLVFEAVIVGGNNPEPDEGPRVPGALERHDFPTELAPEDRVYGPCGVASLFPLFVTDGQRVVVNNQDLDADRVRLNGFRYDIVPSRSTPGGENRELIFSDCVVLEREIDTDPDGVPFERRFFRIPMDAPTGEYDVYIDSGCPTEAPTECEKWARLYVTQSYVVTTVPRIGIVGNSEDTGDSPAELNFQFASQSGEAIQQGSAVRFPTMLSGSFPAGGNGSSHMTHPDDSDILLSLPIFIGEESTMALDECLEECAAFPEDLQDLCVSQCQTRNYSNHFEFSVSGFEKDGGGSQIWGAVVGIGATALGCYASFKSGDALEGCVASAALGNSLGQQVNDLLRDDDDHLGLVSESFQYGLSGFRWGPVGRQGPVRFGGDFKNNGTVDLYYENRRAGGLHIVEYDVRILSIELLEGYEFGCDAPNEVFINARAHLHEGQTNLAGPVRFPGGNDVWSMQEGQTANFGSGLVVGQRSYPAESAPASPILYVEVSVWEDDQDKDLMGNHSQTFFLADLMSTATDIADTASSDGYPVRRATTNRVTIVNGFQGSDDHCSIFATGFDPKGIGGRVKIRYEVSVTALKNFPR